MHEFIYSDQRHYRVARHVAFWTAWCIIYTIFFHYPIHSFKGWDISGSSSLTSKKFTLTAFILKTLIINSLLAVIAPQIILIYFILYWVYPKYVNQKMRPGVIACLVPFLILVYLSFAAPFKYIVQYFNYMAGIINTTPPFAFDRSFQSAMRDQLTTIPIVGGAAIMIYIIKRWWVKQIETELLSKEKTKAELKLLKSQIHPHFLFNTLNNLYFLTLNSSPDAPALIKKLSGMIQYILNECNHPLVPLEQEINMIRDYIDLEKIRYGDQIDISMKMPSCFENKWIAPLLLIPFVENSFKHGASKMLRKSHLIVHLSIENNLLHFCIMNDIPNKQDNVISKGNIGIRNVRKRLDILYPGLHELQIVKEPENFRVSLKIKLQDKTISANNNEGTKSPYQRVLA